MEPKLERVEQEEEKKPYETPELTPHGSIEQLTGDFTVSGLDGV